MKIYLIGTNTISFANDIDFSDLKAFGELHLFPCLSADEVIESCADADILLVNKTDLSAHVIAALPRLKYIGLYSTASITSIFPPAAHAGSSSPTRPIIPPRRWPSIPPPYYWRAREVFWATRPPSRAGIGKNAPHFPYYDYPMVEVSGKTLGIFGFGNIGKERRKSARRWACGFWCIPARNGKCLTNTSKGRNYLPARTFSPCIARKAPTRCTSSTARRCR